MGGCDALPRRLPTRMRRRNTSVFPAPAKAVFRRFHGVIHGSAGGQLPEKVRPSAMVRHSDEV